VNKQAAEKVKQDIERFVHIPDAVHEIGLSLGAVGVFSTWLSHYQQGELMGIVQACGYGRPLDPEFAGYVRELMESGVMPEKYKNAKYQQDLEDIR
jgi:hypothetical protein